MSDDAVAHIPGLPAAWERTQRAMVSGCPPCISRAIAHASQACLLLLRGLNSYATGHPRTAQIGVPISVTSSMKLS